MYIAVILENYSQATEDVTVKYTVKNIFMTEIIKKNEHFSRILQTLFVYLKQKKLSLCHKL